MPIPITPLFRKCSRIATPPESFGLLQLVKSKLSDFINGTNGWSAGFQLSATGAFATTVDELLGQAETTIDIVEVLPMSKKSGFAIIGDPLDDTPEAREVISYTNIGFTGQHQLGSVVRGLYNTTTPTNWANGTAIEQLHWKNDGGFAGSALSVHPHNWQHKATGGLEPPTAFGDINKGVVGVVDSNGNVWAFHPTSASLPVWKFDISVGTWTNPAITGTYTPVTSSLCVFDRSRNKIFILGGLVTGPIQIATLQIFDVATLTFETPGTDTIKDGPLIGAYHEALDRIVYYTDDFDFVFATSGRAYEYNIGTDSHTSKAIHTGVVTYDIEDDNLLADAVYNPNDELIHFVGRLRNSGGSRSHRTYDLNSDTWAVVGTPPIGTGTSYRLTIFRDTNLLFLWVRGSANKTFSHRVNSGPANWFRETDMVRLSEGPIVGYDEETRSAVYFGGRDFSGGSIYADIVGPGFWRPFYETTVYRTRVMDVLTTDPSASIADDVIFLIDDIIPAFSSITYEAENADSASGPFTSIGNVVDGETRDIQKQFWRFTATITASGDVAPIVTKIEVAYQTIATFATNPQAVPPGVATEIDGLIFDLPVASGKIDIEKGRGSKSGINVELDDNIGTARELQEAGRLLDLEARFFIGFNVPSFQFSDMLPVYSGTIAAMDVSLGIVVLALKDTRDNLRIKLPIGSDGSQPIPIDFDLGGISNPVLVLRNILEQAGIPGRDIDDGSFTASSLLSNAAHDVQRTIEEPRELRKYFEEINQLIDGVLIADANGRLKYKIYNATDPPVATFRPNEQDAKWEMSQEFADKINTVTVYGDSSTESGSEVLDYDFGAREQDGLLVIADQRVREEIILGTWIGPNNASFEGLVWAREIAVRRLARKKIGVQRLKGSLTGLKFAFLEEGDIVRLVAESFFERPQSGYEDSHFWPYSVEGQSFVRDNKWAVVKRNVGFTRGKISLELVRARAPLSFDSDDFDIGELNVLESENIAINASGDVEIAAGETTAFVTLLIDMDQCPDLVGTYIITAVVPSGAILTITITPSHDGRFDPRFERTTPLANVPLTSTTLLDGDSKRRFYAFRADLDEGTAGAGNGPVISRVQVDHPSG